MIRTHIHTAIVFLCLTTLPHVFHAQNTLLRSGLVYAMTGHSNIGTNNYNALSEQNFFNSLGLQLGGGLRLSNGIGLEGALGYHLQTWKFIDKTSSEITNGRDDVRFKNKMNYVTLNIGAHKVFRLNSADFMYAKVGFDVNFLKTGDYWNDIGGAGVYEFQANYNNPMVACVTPEIGMFLQSDDQKEVVLFANYKYGLNEFYNMQYTINYQSVRETYDINSSGNGFAVGLKYTFRSRMKQRKKKKKPPKDVIAKKDKRKKKKKKELKIDKDGIPKSLKDRKVEKSKSIKVSGTQLTFKVWDSGKEVDGDTISLNLNGDWVIREFGLKREPHEITVNISPDGKNFLMLYAINEGEFPPNTAAISVWDGEKEQKIQLKSTLKTCGALNIVYEP